MANIREVAVAGYSSGDGYNGTKVPVDPTHPLPTTSTGGTTDTLVGAVNETAPASDTASSGLNGRLQRIAQRLTSILTALGGSDGLRSTTATRSTVNSGTASVTILAANASRKGASIYNSDANTLYLDTSGGTAATTRCQYAIASGQTFEAPFGFTGLITGIWGADGSGLADVVEFT